MSISKQLINGFIKSELELFKKQFDESPVPEIQDVRSLAIAWVCYYFKGGITEKNVKAIIQFVNEVHKQKNFHTHGWFRIPALQAAAFILTAHTYYANCLIQNIDCDQGWARGFIIESASIICPLLSFNNKLLKRATERNISKSHGLFEENIILYLSTQGSVKEKVKWLGDQIEINKDDYRRKFLNGLKTAGRLNPSDFFISAFNKVKSYVIFRMLNQPFLAEAQPSLFDAVDHSFNRLTDLEANHPLNDYYIDLSFLSNEK